MVDLVFQDEGQPSNDTATPIEAASEPVASPDASSTPEPAAASPVAAPAAPEAAKPEPGYVPITALMDERDRRKAAEARAAQYEQQREAPKAPDAWSDPEGFQAHTVAQFQAQLTDTKLNMSEMAAKRHFGVEKVEAAKAWALAKFEKEPAFQNQVLNQTDPYDFAIQQFDRDTIASSVTTDDFAQFQAWKAAQAQLAPATGASASPPLTDPPRSIASQPNSSGGVTHTPIDELSGFNGLFT